MILRQNLDKNISLLLFSKSLLEFSFYFRSGPPMGCKYTYSGFLLIGRRRWSEKFQVMGYIETSFVLEESGSQKDHEQHGCICHVE